MQNELKGIKEEIKEISLVAYEASEERHRQERKHLVTTFAVIIILLILSLIGSNLAWLIYDKSMETVEESNVITEENTSETYDYDVNQNNENGNNNFIGRDGDINNG